MKSTLIISILCECFSFDEIESVAKNKLRQKLTSWEKEFYSFILEWFNKNDYVEIRTSGSTGNPKIIRLPKCVMKKSAERTIEYFSLQSEDSLLLSLSCSYIAGKMMVVRAFTGKIKLTVVDPATDFCFLNDNKYDFGAVVPLQLSKLLQTENGKQKAENIRHLLVGGSTVPVALEEKIRQLKNNVVSTYGMTETASHIAIRKLSGKDASDSYHCLPGISIQKKSNGCLDIFAEEQGKWLSTTDMVKIMSLKEFKILGRADHVIISGGLKFHPEQLEKKLGSFIRQPVMISSESDDKLGQKLVLIVEGIESEPLKQEIQQSIKQCFGRYERPKKIFFIKQLPRNANGKIIRK